METLLNELRCNILGTKGGDAYMVSTHETEDLRAWETELRSKRDAAKESSERFFFDLFLSTIHFNQCLCDWQDEIRSGFQIANGDYLDYVYVALYRAGVNGEEVNRFLGTKRSRGGHYSVNWKRIRKEILRRDKYTCSACGSHEHLEVHHKRWWWDNGPGNLVTLCRKCHHENVGTGL